MNMFKQEQCHFTTLTAIINSQGVQRSLTITRSTFRSLAVSWIFLCNFACFFFLSFFFFYRIIDNMPVTWCYDVEDGQKYCNPGFPIGCLVAGDGRAKDACVINVSFWL